LLTVGIKRKITCINSTRKAARNHNETLARRNDRNFFKTFQTKKIVIASHDYVRIGSERGSQNSVIIAVATNAFRESGGSDNCRVSAQRSKNFARFSRGQASFAEQRSLQFSKNVSRDNYLSVLKAFFIQDRANARGYEGREKDVGVKNDPHETALNTSSSV
jgi:hypothetical protein